MITKTDTQKLLDLIQPFYNLTGIKVAVYDVACREMLAYPAHNAAFCAMMDQSLCAQSTRQLCGKCVGEKRVLIETCHAGLTEVIAPLFDGVSVIGYIMFGQITNRQDRETFFCDVTKRCAEYGLDARKLHDTLAQILYYSDAQLDDASKILGALARCIVYDKLVYPAEDPIIQKIIAYIRQNLAEDLSVKALCSVFYLSKSEIYRMTKPYMPRGIAAFVKEERLKKAAELLKSTGKSSWEIAAETGFADVNYFLRSFKAEYGISAAKYRQKL